MYVCLNTFIYYVCIYIYVCMCTYTFTTYQGNYCRLLLGYICFPFSAGVFYLGVPNLWHIRNLPYCLFSLNS